MTATIRARLIGRRPAFEAGRNRSVHIGNGRVDSLSAEPVAAVAQV